jgi:hypothetical protein
MEGKGRKSGYERLEWEAEFDAVFWVRALMRR